MTNNINLQISIPLDDDGYLDRECPADACNASFKVHADDWLGKVRDEKVFCPVCGHTETSDHWLTEEQVEYCKGRMLQQVMPVVQNMLQKTARSFNQRQSPGGIIQMSMTVKPSRPIVVVPLEAAELMRQRYTCEVCGCRYAAIGAAFFCPSCGHNSAKSAFRETINTIRKLPQVKIALDTALERDDAANTYRLLLEENMGKLVGTFQRFAEATFEALTVAGSIHPRRNVFQNLLESSDLWEQAIGIRYEDMISMHDWQAIQRYFQQRHLLAHKDGLVDVSYIQKTNDAQYQAGQRLVIKEDDVILFVGLVEKLADALINACHKGNDAEG